MSTFRRYIPSLREAVTPGIFRDLRNAYLFAEGLDSRRRALPRYRAAASAGLDLLPTGLRLIDGLVVDVGANVGDWTTAVLTVEPRARALAFEPGMDAYRRLHDRFRTDSRVTVVQRAVGARTGDADLHVTRHSHNASLRRPRPSTGQFYPGDGWEIAELQRINVVRLDDVIDEPVSVLKIDVQGAEGEVLRGAKRTLLRTAAVLMEVTFVSHYEQDSSFGDLHEAMTETGFALVGMSDPFRSIDGRLLWCDACYSRGPWSSGQPAQLSGHVGIETARAPGND